MTDTATTPTAPAAPTPPKPGFATSEGWISLLVVILGALPTTVLANTSPMWVQIAGLIAASVTAIVHSSNRTALKRDHLAAVAPHLVGDVLNTADEAAPVRAPEKGSVRLALIALLAFLAVGFIACGAAQKSANHAAAVCTEDAVTKALEPTVQSVLTSGLTNWEALLVAFGGAFGPAEINCAVTFVEATLKAQVGAAPGTADAISRAEQYLKDHP
jgi:hypothetical protein